ncbi:hypothetical protein BM1_06695 [Bipolaris maydis]|nr:hypothetical protein BM1_06695 [Bipolaris maydis]KAJ5021920.1 hypothetical protein J3E73DRAFT_374907 [Bipolaris maydis]KAJ6275502.1 hypothetical protein PSV08DRAFT_345890 [Bipolaris maydis]
MARKTPRKPKTTKRAKSKKKDMGDWMENLKELDYIKLLERVATIHPLVSMFLGNSETEVLEKISDALTEIAPELKNQRETMENTIRLCMEQMSQLQSEQFQNLGERLDSLEGLLSTFNRAGIAGQFTGFFAGAEAIAQIRRLANSVEKIEGSLKGIERNLDAISEQGDKFPHHIHEWLRMMIHEHSTDNAAHYFAVFDRGTRWHPKFFAINEDNPLGRQYLGHKTDLDELCAFLADEVRPRVGPHAVLHILMPSTKLMAFADSVKFPEEIRPFYIHGEVGSDGLPFVWLCTPDDYDKARLKHIGPLKPRGIWARIHVVQAPGPLSLLLRWVSKVTWHIDPSFLNRMCGVNLFDVYETGLFYKGPEPPRTLGRPCTHPWYTQNRSQGV